VTDLLARSVAPPLLPLELLAATPQPGEAREHKAPPQRSSPRATLVVNVAAPMASDDPTPTDARYERLEEIGRAAVRTWITHPAVASEVAAAKPVLDRLVDPLVLPDEWAVTLVVARLLDVAGRYPDGTTWPNPFAGAPAEVRAAVRRIGPPLVAALEGLAQRLAAAGVPLDPLDRSVLLVLAQLALLDVDLADLTRDLVDDLNVLPPCWIDRTSAEQGQVVAGSSRHGRSVRVRADLDAVAEDVARDLSPLGAFRAPYAGGGRRSSVAKEHRQAARRDALREVLDRHPDVTAGRIIATWGAGPSTPGGLLRTTLDLQPQDRPPSEATLRADLEQLRR
jgi:hypothetical protein